MAALLLSGQAFAAGSTIRLVERATTDAVTVHGDKTGNRAGDNVGNILTFANPIYDAANSKMLGSDQGFCVRTVAGKSFECHWTLTLADGQIAVDGPFQDAGDSMLAITGGTGAYNGARGQMKLHARDAHGTSYDFTYMLQ